VTYRNAGFDLVLFFRTEPREEGCLPLFVECKVSFQESTTTLGLPVVQQKYVSCKQFAIERQRTERFPVMFLCLRDIAKSTIMKAPMQCMFLDRAHADVLCGPTLSALIHTVEGSLHHAERTTVSC
jgi:hypothetical protein